MSQTKISKIINRLLTEENMRVSELARKVKLPQPTVQRIAAGVCENPHISSLKPIADYFSITVDQLKGFEPIPKFDRLVKIPLLAWEDVSTWHAKFITNTEENVMVDVEVSKQAYALRLIDSAMEPVFPYGTILILDPLVKAKDRSYIITLLKNSDMPIFRQLIINGPDKFLKPLSPDTQIYKMLRLKNTDNVLATVVQARWNYTA